MWRTSGSHGPLDLLMIHNQYDSGTSAAGFIACSPKVSLGNNDGIVLTLIMSSTVFPRLKSLRRIAAVT